MSLPALDNLVRIGQLKAEPRNEPEVRRMLAMARTRLADAQLATLSLEGRFTSAYNAAHAAALAALRWHGYRSETATPCSSVSRIRSAGRRPVGGYSMPHTKSGISLNTKASLKSRKPASKSFVCWPKS
jgi:hypothetical protein